MTSLDAVPEDFIQVSEIALDSPGEVLLTTKKLKSDSESSFICITGKGRNRRDNSDYEQLLFANTSYNSLYIMIKGVNNSVHTGKWFRVGYEFTDLAMSL